MESNTNCENKLTLIGTIASDVVLNHTVFGEGFYHFDLKVKRISGVYDVLPVTVSERLISIEEIHTGDTVRISGQIRSYNKQIGKANRLIITVFAKNIERMAQETPHENEIFLSGYICKPTVYRVTPFGREISDILLAINRSYNKSDYIPCIAWGRNAKFVGELKMGDKIVLEGRIQSREYEKVLESGEKETRKAFEVSVAKLKKEEPEEETRSLEK